MGFLACKLHATYLHLYYSLVHSPMIAFSTVFDNTICRSYLYKRIKINIYIVCVFMLIIFIRPNYISSILHIPDYVEFNILFLLNCKYGVENLQENR